MKEKIKFEAQSVTSAEASKDIIDIVKKRGISYPSDHLGFFKTVYARIETANRNGVRLARKAVEEALPGLVGAQTNFEHLRAGFLCGAILDAKINDNDEIEVVYSFFKSIYPEEYEQSLELMEEGKLSVSFELLADRDTQEKLEDGTVRLNDISFIGMGHLMEEDPAEPTARVFEFAKRVKNRVSHFPEKDLVMASKIEKACDNVLAEQHDEKEPEIYLVTTNVDNHFHLAKIDWDGNGETITTNGTDDTNHTHRVVNWQIQESDAHAHQILDSIMATLKEIKAKRNMKNVEKKQKTEESKLNEEDKKKVDEIRAELGDVVAEASDEDLLNEEKVEAFRKQKEDAEKASKEEDSELEKANERIKELEAEIATLKSTLEAKDSEIEAVRENAEKIATLKIEMKDNPHVADFSDEDYLDESKVEQARTKKERDDLKAEVEALKKASEKEPEEVEASEKKKEVIKASEKETEENTDYSDVIDARVIEFKNKKNR